MGSELSPREPARRDEEVPLWGCVSIKSTLQTSLTPFFKQSQKGNSRKPVAGSGASRKLKNSTRRADRGQRMCLCYPNVAPTKGEAVKTAFDKPMSDEWTSRALAHAIYGGADFGECTTT